MPYGVSVCIKRCLYVCASVNSEPLRMLKCLRYNQMMVVVKVLFSKAWRKE